MLPEISPKSKTGESKPKYVRPQLAQTAPLSHSCENTGGYTLLSPSFASQLDSPAPRLLQSTFDTGAFMPIPKDLLEILVCPECKTPLRHLADSANRLKCDTCHRVYPIRDEIPGLIIDLATKD